MKHKTFEKLTEKFPEITFKCRGECFENRNCMCSFTEIFTNSIKAHIKEIKYQKGLNKIRQRQEKLRNNYDEK